VIEGAFHEPASFSTALGRFSPDTVFHLAWHGVRRGLRDDASQIDVNVGGSINLFRTAVDVGVRSFVAAGSQAEYGPATERLNEGHPTRPRTLYGAAKLATSVLLERLAELDAVQLAWLRVFSVYGPRDDADTLISSLVRQFLAGERPAVTSGAQLWDYLHVDDAADAFLSVARSGASGVMNVGAGLATPLRDTITMVRDLIDPSLEIGFGEVPIREGAVTRLEPDIARLQAATGWAPRIGLEEGLRGTIEWHRKSRALREKGDALLTR
jgi:nucleoside-diphosphate-sugar epimerase